ncbi:MAG: glycosyltransferase family 39 protein, partial [Pseudomonadota bacterium]|nr:glycosyltransferase family 39 protein [Pseudomonadota bacterium]
MIQAGAGSAGRKPLTARQTLLLVLLLFFAAGLRIVHLDRPAEKVFDEYHYVGAAQVMAGMAGMAENPGVAPDPYYHHPPLGKLIIAAGIRLFGDTPFGWRIFAALFGLLSVGLLFQIAFKLFDSFFLAWVSAFVYSLDFLHIIHSRLAMLDIFLAAPVLAGMLSSLYLLERPRSRIWMAVSAISWAIALAIKANTLIYLAAFLIIYVTFSREKPIERFGSVAIILLSAILLFSLSSFYYLTNGYSFVDWLQMRWDATFNFTSRAPSHPYESAPPMWLFNAKAIWYHFDNAARTGILGFGNPALWLAFIPALFIVFSAYRVEKRRTDLFLL